MKIQDVISSCFCVTWSQFTRSCGVFGVSIGLVYGIGLRNIPMEDAGSFATMILVCSFVGLLLAICVCAGIYCPTAAKYMLEIISKESGNKRSENRRNGERETGLYSNGVERECFSIFWYEQFLAVSPSTIGLISYIAFKNGDRIAAIEGSVGLLV